MLVEGKDFSVRGKLNLKNVKIKRLVQELEQLKNSIDSVLSDSELNAAHDPEEYAEKQVEILELEQELQLLIKEIKDVSSVAADRAGKVVVEDMFYTEDNYLPWRRTVSSSGRVCRKV